MPSQWRALSKPEIPSLASSCSCWVSRRGRHLRLESTRRVVVAPLSGGSCRTCIDCARHVAALLQSPDAPRWPRALLLEQPGAPNSGRRTHACWPRVLRLPEMARSSAAKRPTFASKGSTLCGQTSVLVWLNAVRALRAWKQTVAILAAPPVVTIILVLLQLLANVVVDKEGERPRGSGADLAGKLAPTLCAFGRLAATRRSRPRAARRCRPGPPLPVRRVRARHPLRLLLTDTLAAALSPTAWRQ